MQTRKFTRARIAGRERERGNEGFLLAPTRCCFFCKERTERAQDSLITLISTPSALRRLPSRMKHAARLRDRRKSCKPRLLRRSEAQAEAHTSELRRRKGKEALFLSPEASRRHHFQATLSSHVIAKIQSQKGNEAAGKDGKMYEAKDGAKSV